MVDIYKDDQLFASSDRVQIRCYYSVKGCGGLRHNGCNETECCWVIYYQLTIHCYHLLYLSVLKSLLTVPS
jgi:hypothetical protein